MMSKRGPRQRIGERRHVEGGRPGHPGRAVFGIELLVFVMGTGEIPDKVHAPVIPADEVFGAEHNPSTQALVVAVHVGMAVFRGERFGAGVKFR